MCTTCTTLYLMFRKKIKICIACGIVLFSPHNKKKSRTRRTQTEQSLINQHFQRVRQSQYVSYTRRTQSYTKRRGGCPSPYLIALISAGVRTRVGSRYTFEALLPPFMRFLFISMPIWRSASPIWFAEYCLRASIFSDLHSVMVI